MMNYIVLDLEWNQSAKGKKYTLPGMPFEIIQMGAVKLDNKFDVIDEFDRDNDRLYRSACRCIRCFILSAGK